MLGEHDGGLHEVAGALAHLAAAEHAGALGLQFLQHLLVALHRALGSISGPIRVPGLQRIANGDLLVGGDESRGEFIQPALVDQQPAGRGAALTGSADGAEEYRGYRQVEVRVLVDDDGVVAAEFQQAAAEAPGHTGWRHRAPTAEEPVKDTRSTRGSSTKRVASATSSVLKRKKAGGKLPASRAALHRRCTATLASGAFGDGFQTDTLPHTAAMNAFQDQTATGKLKALMMPTTPTGCHCS